MRTLVVQGGRPLRGELHIHGAKNSILPILSACILSSERNVITRCPKLSDVTAAMEILDAIGCRGERLGEAVVVDASSASRWSIPHHLMGKMRASVTFLGALLGRFGHGEMTYPGGCTLGKRPIDYHIAALKTLGVTLEEEGENLKFAWHHRRGGEVFLPFPSVGATENVLMAAVTANDETVIRNAAREPEVADLCKFLCAMGAEISGIGTNTLYIRGGKTLHGTTYCVIPDRMETATYLAMTAACGGRIRLRDTDPNLLRPVLDTLRGAGCQITLGEKEITLTQSGRLSAPRCIITAAYPGFPTDAQAPMVAALLRAQGECTVEETVFSQRFDHVTQLRKFGGNIRLEKNSATILGVEKLSPAHVRATDLRGGAGVLIAALQAMGESRVDCSELLARGYADLLGQLRRLGVEAYETLTQE
ncbi:MAG: UDP-N-acetylglucosamine 1-carboxyvinyltransferase [Oscillospiraceae bacterium]|nr:UDP-N-acetylglucosamine 1-carboxyvinyltransferase [Oscillospiraceae bacterium]